MPQGTFIHAKTLGHAWEIPDRLESSFGDHNIATRQEDSAVNGEAPFGDRLLEFWHVDMGARHRNSGTNVIATDIKIGEDLADHGSKRVERHDRVRLSPTRVWSKRCHRGSVGEVRTMTGL
jgi:hypothetical protein